MECNQTTIDNFLDYVIARNLSTATVLPHCNDTGKDVCKLAWGVGNPDISGIGAVAAYIVQVTLTCLICPVYAILFAWFGRYNNPHVYRNGHSDSSLHDVDHQGDERKGSKISKRTAKNLRLLSKNLDSFVDISCQFAIMISIASIVRIAQGATFFEKVFLQALILTQVLGVFAVCVASIPGPKRNLVSLLLIWSSNKKLKRKQHWPSPNPSEDGTATVVGEDTYQESHVDEHKDINRSRHFKRMCRLALYSLLTLSLLWVFFSRFDVSVSRISAIRAVLSFCSSEYSDIEHPWSGYIVSDAWPSWLRTLIHIQEVDSVIVVIIFIIVYSACTLSIYALTPAGVAIALCAPMVYFMVEMLIQREYMAKVTEGSWQDGTWGFGQVLALLMWLPFMAWSLILWFTMLLTYCYDRFEIKWFKRWKSRKGKANGISVKGTTSARLNVLEDGMSGISGSSTLHYRIPPFTPMSPLSQDIDLTEHPKSLSRARLAREWWEDR